MTPAITAALALASCLGAWTVVRRLPPPRDPDPDAPVPHYPALATRGWVAVSSLLACSLGWWAGGVSDTPGAHSVWAGAGLVLVTVDLRTTYLPLRLHRLTAALTTVGLLPAVVRHPVVGLRSAACALVAGLFFWLLWRVVHAFGFGDVRLAALGAALAGASTASEAYLAIGAGTVIGAAHGLATSWWRRRHPSPLGRAFAYGPALWAGVWVPLLT